MKNIKKLVLFITMIIVIGGVNVYAASVGEKLSEPEPGWVRYDESNSNILYSNDWLNCSSDSYHQGVVKYTNVTGATINFKFHGTKLRLLGVLNEDRPSDIEVLIDGVPYVGNQYASSVIWKGLFFEITDLTLDTHTIQITTKNTATTSLDAIDIDEDGYLLGQLGTKLLEPEQGWKRYDDSDINLEYVGDFLTSTSNECYNSSAHWLESNPVAEGTKIKFKFSGSKLRIISSIHNDYTKSLIVNVDGNEYIFSQYNTETIYQILIGEITNLTNEIHNVEIYSSDNLRYNLDAVDIDDDGELLSWYTPNNLSANIVDGKIKLIWDVVDGADSYTLLRSTTLSTIDTVIANGLKDTTYIDDNVEPGITYYYVVRAVKNGVESDNSNIASAMIENTNTAVLQIKLSTTDVYEYRVTMNEVNNFMKWYIDRANGTGLPFYSFSDESKIEPYTDVNEYLIFDKIIWFKVKEYLR